MVVTTCPSSRIRMHNITQLTEPLLSYAIPCFVFTYVSVCACVGDVVEDAVMISYDLSGQLEFSRQ